MDKKGSSKIISENKDVTTILCKNWKNGLKEYHQILPSKVELKPIVLNPSDIDFNKLSTENKPENLGTFSINPELDNIDFNKIDPSKIKVITLNEMAGKQLHEVAKLVVDKYSKDHLIPDIRFATWLLNLDSKDARYKDFINGSENFLFGTVVSGPKGAWRIIETQYNRTIQAFSLTYVWKDANFEWRVIVIEK